MIGLLGAFLGGWRARLALACISLTLAGAALAGILHRNSTRCGGHSIERRGYILTEMTSGRIIRLPCILLEDGPSATPHLVRLIGAHPIFGESQLYDGISGSPVFGASGAQVGLISAVADGRPTRNARIVALDVVAEDLKRVAARDEGLRHLGEESVKKSPPPPLHLGEHVCVADVWGDMVRGTSGTVGHVSGSLCVLYGHGVTRVGRLERCLLEADVVAYVGGNVGASELSDVLAQAQVVIAPGRPVGRVFYDGPLGLYAVLGIVPPHVTIRWLSVEADASYGSNSREFFLLAAQDDFQGRLQWAVAQVNSGLSSEIRGRVLVREGLHEIDQGGEHLAFQYASASELQAYVYEQMRDLMARWKHSPGPPPAAATVTHWLDLR